MRVIRGFPTPAVGLEGTAVTVGNFDGVHRGHRAVIESAVADARQRRVVALVCTFDPHTRAVVEPRRPPALLQTLEQRLAVFEELGADLAVVIPFDRGVASLSPEAFVRDFLVGALRPGALHVSDDFAFGRQGAGDVAYLRRAAGRWGFELTVVEPVTEGGRRISSTWVRELVAAGDVEGAARLLGRPFALVGTVVPGVGRGKGLGAPTANLEVENGCLPGRGVYVTEARTGTRTYPSVTNVGLRPTFGPEDRLVVETHLLDFRGELSGARVELAFLQRLRDEIAFADGEALAAQIRKDVARAAAYFRSHRKRASGGR